MQIKLSLKSALFATSTISSLSSDHLLPPPRAPHITAYRVTCAPSQIKAGIPCGSRGELGKQYTLESEDPSGQESFWGV